MRLLALGVCLIAAAQNAGAADHRVIIQDMAFSPKVLMVKPGDTITWVNKDMFVHNVTAAAAGIKSGELKPGQSWRQVLRQGESFDYLCTLHPVMMGRVEVKEDTKAEIRPARRRSTS
ncbi:Amicyanin [Massilia sp. Bi118]|uniref:cupredoxin domain-containing protein n=1 Tax=Massilia sp. Bi118 TaxID=2822346 RepID=UPI001DABA9A0|nr:cupredoxin family copper-binding protein [Massilia sp. Bi118]CAH0285864.1 Amicyanin [Massilia sp. Bi118]